MATRRKIARSAVRRVKRRNTKNTKLRSLRSRKHAHARKNSTEKKRMSMHEMSGGGMDFKVYMVYYGNLSLLKQCPDSRLSHNLVGVLFYYPNNNEFWLCGYEDFGINTYLRTIDDTKAKDANYMTLQVHERTPWKSDPTVTILDKLKQLNLRSTPKLSDNIGNINLELICKLCGIPTDGMNYTVLKKMIDDKTNAEKFFMKKMIDDDNFHTRDHTGEVSFCIKLNKRFMRNVWELQFIQYEYIKGVAAGNNKYGDRIYQTVFEPKYTKKDIKGEEIKSDGLLKITDDNDVEISSSDPENGFLLVNLGVKDDKQNHYSIGDPLQTVNVARELFAGRVNETQKLAFLNIDQILKRTFYENSSDQSTDEENARIISLITCAGKTQPSAPN